MGARTIHIRHPGNSTTRLAIKTVSPHTPNRSCPASAVASRRTASAAACTWNACRLLDESDCLCLASGLGLCVCLAYQSLRLVRWSDFVRLERIRQVGAVSSGWSGFVRLERFRQVGADSSGWSGFVKLERFRQVGAVSSGWSGFVRFLPTAPTRRAYRWPDRARSSSSPNSQPSSTASSAACTSARRS
jgi:hypothetical protein